MPPPWNIIFAGTAEIAIPSLQALFHDPRYTINAVITSPDTPVGRKQILTPSPLKVAANHLKIPLIQETPHDPKYKENLKKLSPHFLVVFAYGYILSQEILDIPLIAPINIHGSLLPKYRGASPVQAALLEGEPSTGISVMHMSKRMDAGSIYSQETLPLSMTDTTPILTEKLSIVSQQVLPDILEKIALKTLSPLPQKESEATYCKKISRSDGEIHCDKESAEEIYQKWKAFTPWPGIFLFLEGKRIKLLKINLSQKSIPPGQFVKEEGQLFLGCIEGSLEIIQFQREGKKPSEAKYW